MVHSLICKLICAISVCNILTVGVHISSTPSIRGPGSATVTPVLKNSRSKYRRSAVYPFISKCNAKRCSCCKHFYVVNQLLNLTLLVDNFL